MTDSATGSGVPFHQALRAAIEDGAHVARAEWPAGVYVTAQAGYPAGISVNANTAAATGLAEGVTAVFRPYLMRRLRPATAVVRGVEYPAPPAFVPWTPDQEDLFAADWQVRPRPGRHG